jgi:DNA polymerase-3 subunit delta'
MTKNERQATENWGMLGHDWAVGMLKEHLTHAAVRHAYLITGPSGLGRRTLALRFAQALNCPQPPAPGESCGTCKTCRQIEAMQFPDLAVVQSEHEGGVLKVEQVRTVLHSLALKPYQAKYRVALFLRFQEANLSAANALLKTLEEAPSYAVMVLTAEASEQLLPTVVSRCEVLRLRPLPVQAVEKYLAQKGLAEDQSRLLAGLSGGRPGYALRLRDDPAALEFRRQRIGDVAKLLAGTRRERFAYAESLARDKDACRSAFLLWLGYWRDVLLRTAGAATPIANVDRSEEVEKLAAQLSLPEVRRRVADLEQAVERLERNVNARLLAEVVLLDWPRANQLQA